MSEQDGQEATPAVAGPDGAPGTAEATEQAEIDWQKRYVDIQTEYTRSQQENAELRHTRELHQALLSTDDPDTQRAIAEELGLQFEEEENQSDGYEDPIAYVDERVGRIEERQAEREQEQAEAERQAVVSEYIDDELDQLEGLDKADRDWVALWALQMLPPTEQGMPDIRQAHEVFTARETERQRNWARTKRAPHISPHGQSATEAPNLDNRQERQDFIMRLMLEDEQAQ